MTENTELSRPHRHTVTIGGVTYDTDESGVHRHAYGTPTPPPPTGAALGLYVPGEDPDKIAALATALGVTCTVENVACWADASGQAACELTALPHGADGAVTPYRVMLAVGNVDQAQATAIAATLMAAGKADTILRPLWELNAPSFPWGFTSLTAAQQIAAFRGIVATFRAVPNMQFRFCWNVLAGTRGMWAGPGRTWDDSYPGDDVVDLVGIDVYDDGGDKAAICSPALAFAVAHNKPLAIPEWGLNGTDDVAYMDQIIAMIKGTTPPCALQVYFNGSLQDLTTPAYAASKAAYTKAFG